jgi:hypothetical protein
MRTAQFPLTTLASLLIAAAVALSGTHAKDIVTVTQPLLWQEAKQKADETGSKTVKAVSDLHNHVDKVKVQHHSGDAGQQADTRSLRLLHHKKAAMIHNRLSDRMRLWWTLTSLRLAA